ncbi:TadE/TadG family type IV pilus assembly protein [Pseudooceanicola sp. MF1-13]|uniref:TadE/TadG family type IV pilus assembly protein n=1 Tax=Pseudooceanicola sp. MF1-13 TaxID=3379095 RepID=UPI003892788E
MKHIRIASKNFLKNESGVVSLEFAIWVPLVFGIFLTVLDFAHAMTVNSTMWHQARIAARGLSMHEISPQDARELINSGLHWTRSDYQIDIVEDRSTVRVSIKTPMKTSGIIDFATAKLSGNWVAEVEILREPV